MDLRSTPGAAAQEDAGGAANGTFVTWSIEAGVATIAFADPPRRNALSNAMLEELLDAFAAAKAAAARAVILRSRIPGKVWSAGFDIAEIAAGTDPLQDGGLLDRLFRAVSESPAPVIGLVDGSVWGGGADLALRCDLLVGTPGCSFAFTPAKLGLPYVADGLLNVLLRAGLGTALEMFATGLPIDAERALRLGLLNHLVPAAEAEACVLGLGQGIAANAPLAVAAAKAQLHQLAAAILATIPRAQTAALRAPALASEDFREGLEAFRERRSPRFTGR